jgi:hypothetical protein
MSGRTRRHGALHCFPFDHVSEPSRRAVTSTRIACSSWQWITGLDSRTCGESIVHAYVRSLTIDSKAYLGIYSNDVQPGRRENRKSVGCERFVPLPSALLSRPHH